MKPTPLENPTTKETGLCTWKMEIYIELYYSLYIAWTNLETIGQLVRIKSLGSRLIYDHACC